MGAEPGNGRSDRDRLRPRDDLLADEHGLDAALLERARRVDAPDARVRVRAAADGQVQRERLLDVVDEAAAAAQEAVVLLALHAGAEPGELIHRRRSPRRPGAGSARRPRRCSGSPCTGRGCRPAPRAAPRPRGRRPRLASATAPSRKPGVQYPHWSACASRNACCTGCSSPRPARPSTVVIDRPCAWGASMRHDFTGSPSSSTVHAPQTPCSQPTWVPWSWSSWRRKSTSSRRLSTTRS